MTAHILVVDDEPDVEALVRQKFRHKIRGGAISFLFARDGVEALAALKANGAPLTCPWLNSHPAPSDVLV